MILNFYSGSKRLESQTFFETELLTTETTRSNWEEYQLIFHVECTFICITHVLFLPRPICSCEPPQETSFFYSVFSRFLLHLHDFSFSELREATQESKIDPETNKRCLTVCLGIHWGLKGKSCLANPRSSQIFLVREGLILAKAFLTGKFSQMIRAFLWIFVDFKEVSPRN